MQKEIKGRQKRDEMLGKLGYKNKKTNDSFARSTEIIFCFSETRAA